MMPNLKMPTADEVGLARESGAQLVACIRGNDVVAVRVNDDPREIRVPLSALRLLVEGLNHMAAGDAVEIRSFPADLTVRQAAEILNVSPAYVRKLKDEDALAFRLVHGHLRVPLADVLVYLRTDRERRKEALDELTRLSQEMDPSY